MLTLNFRSVNDNLQMTIKLSLQFKPKNIRSIRYNSDFQLFLQEINSNFNPENDYTRDMIKQYDNDTKSVSFRAENKNKENDQSAHKVTLKEMKRLNSLTFRLDMKKLMLQAKTKYNSRGEWPYKTVSIESLPFFRYKWEVNDNREMEIVYLNDLKFVLKILYDQNGKLYAESTLIYPQYIDEIVFKFIKLEVEQTNSLTYSSITHFQRCKINKESDQSLTIICNTDLTATNFRQLKQLSVNLSFAIITVHSILNQMNWKNYFVKSKSNREFLDSKQNQSEYVWKISESELQNMITIKTVYGCMSKIFEAHSLKWYINLFPNGKNMQNDSKIDLSLNLASFPARKWYPFIVIAKCSIDIKEMNYKYQKMIYFKSINDLFTIPSIQHSDIDANTLTLKFIIELIDVYNVIHDDTQLITNDFTMRKGIIELPITNRRFVWNVRRASLTNLLDGHTIKSPKFYEFKMIWQLLLYPNVSGLTKVFINVSTTKDDLKIYARCSIQVEEANVRYTGTARFGKLNYNQTYNERCIDSWGFEEEILLTKKLVELNSCTIVITIELVDVFDHDGCDVIAEFPKNKYNY
eukprot:197153_1